MTVKEYLSKLKKLTKKIQKEKGKLKQLQDTTQLVGGQGQGEKVQSSPTLNAQYADMVEAIVELETKIAKLVKEQSTYTEVIKSLSNPKHVKVLMLCHAEGLKLYEAADIMAYSYDHIRHLHTQAIKALSHNLNAT